MDNSIRASQDEQELDAIIQQMKDVGLKISRDRGIEVFLGINIECKKDGLCILMQIRLFESILKDLGLNRGNMTPKQAPTASSKILSKHTESPAFNGNFHY
jgi:hypothetical protein